MLRKENMKTNMLWMLAAILTCGVGMSLTSCSDNVDNSGGIIPTPQPGPDDYKIVVGEGMVMPENEFETKVPAIDGDPAVVSALKAIDGVMDVKAFGTLERIDFFAKKIIQKTAYYFNFKQPVDHNNPSKGWFKQQCVLTLAGTVGNSRPTVLHTEGYALDKDNNRLDWIGEPMLVSVLDANCLQVEYRYHGWSLPEGWTNDFHYLSAKQQSDDLEAGSATPGSPLALTRAATVNRYDANLVQTCTEMGHYIYDVSWFDDLLTTEEKSKFTEPFHDPAGFGVTYDGGQYVREFLQGMKQSNCPMMFVYSMQDPWTGGQIPDEYLGRNSQKMFIQNGTHNDYIDKWNASERNQLFQWLKSLGFDL